jgi:hypothetical protein
MGKSSADGSVSTSDDEDTSIVSLLLSCTGDDGATSVASIGDLNFLLVYTFETSLF